MVYNMSVENPGDVSYSTVGGLGEQIREIREVIELPLLNPELFVRVGITPPKGVLLYGPPGTGKTLLARAIASNVDANFLKVVASGIVDKYIGESARLIREMFGRERTPPGGHTAVTEPAGALTGHAHRPRHLCARTNVLRTQATHATTSRASFSWTKLTRSAGGVSPRARRPTVRFSAP